MAWGSLWTKKSPRKGQDLFYQRHHVEKENETFVSFSFILIWQCHLVAISWCSLADMWDNPTVSFPSKWVLSFEQFSCFMLCMDSSNFSWESYSHSCVAFILFPLSFTLFSFVLSLSLFSFTVFSLSSLFCLSYPVSLLVFLTCLFCFSFSFFALLFFFPFPFKQDKTVFCPLLRWSLPSFLKLHWIDRPLHLTLLNPCIPKSTHTISNF